MDHSRRQFLQAAGILVAASTLPSWAFGAQFPEPVESDARIDSIRWPMVQGATDAKSTSIVLLHPTQENLRIKVLGPGRRQIHFRLTERMDLPNSTLSITEIFISGLVPDVDFELQMLDGNGNPFDKRRFRALDTSRPNCRFAVVSCMNDSSSGRISMWQAVQREACDFVVFLGDTCYADNGNPEQNEEGYARRYAETRAALGWFRMERLTPCLATWDDHDFGLNNADRHFRHGKFTKKLFRKFWGSTENSIWKKKFGVGSVFYAFGQRFYLLDDRSFRDLEGKRGGSHLGREQTDWLLADLNRDDRPAWLMNGSQFFGAYLGKESFEADHPEDFRNFLGRLSRVRAPVSFVSGDVHFSEIMLIEPEVLGYQSYEFTSSSIHSITIPFHQHRARNPRRIDSEWKHNYLIFESDTSRGWEIGVSCQRENNRNSFRHNLEIRR